MNSSPFITFSIVVFRHRYEQISDLISAIQQLPVPYRLYVIDNSPSNELESFLPVSESIRYVHSPRNVGYGSGHNLAIREVLGFSKYHLVINPDIFFTPEAILKMIAFMEQSPNVGLLMPKVLYGNGELQYLCKMFPTPFDLIMRRFIPGFLKSRLQNRLDQYELKHKDYQTAMEVPNLSGCFMFLRVEVLRIVGLFDERFFMYLEDTDLSRRINLQFQTLYYPEVSIIHQYEKGSYKSFKLLKYHIVSAFRYFNKYGWFFDPVRSTINGTLK